MVPLGVPTIGAVATKWLDYIRVGCRTFDGSKVPRDWPIRFGPTNVMVPARTREEAEKNLERLRTWLTRMMAEHP